MKTTSKASSFSLKNNRKIKIFLLFLVLTSIIWLLIELSKSYTSIATFKVEYENIPADKLLQNTLISQVDLAIKAPGFSLIKYKAKQHKITFNLDNIAKNKTAYYLLPNSQLSYLSEQLPRDIEVVHVMKDTIFIELGNTISKKVPIHPNIDIKFKLGYNFIEKLTISPDSVLVTGPKKIIDSIFEITTFPIKLSEVYETINTELQLKLPTNNNHIKLSISNIQITGNVDKFTEGSFKIPVKVINEPVGVKINPFPKEVEVFYQVGLSNFSKINKDSFSVVFDYNQYNNDTLTRYLTPVIIQKSELIYAVKIIPSQIEFLIKN